MFKLKSRYKKVNVETILIHFELISKLLSIIFKAPVKTCIADVSHLNVRVTALVVMFLGCLETARNPAIGVMGLDPEVG